MTAPKLKLESSTLDTLFHGPVVALSDIGLIIYAMMNMQSGFAPGALFLIEDVVAYAARLRPTASVERLTIDVIPLGVSTGHLVMNGVNGIEFTHELLVILMEQARKKEFPKTVTQPMVGSTFIIMGKTHTSKEVEALCHLLAVYHDHAERFGMPPDNSFTFGGMTFDHKTIMELLECMAEDPIFRLVLGSYHPNSQMVNVQQLYRGGRFQDTGDRSRDRGGYDRDGGGRYGTRNDRGRF